MGLTSERDAEATAESVNGKLFGEVPDCVRELSKDVVIRSVTGVPTGRPANVIPIVPCSCHVGLHIRVECAIWTSGRVSLCERVQTVWSCGARDEGVRCRRIGKLSNEIRRLSGLVKKLLSLPFETVDSDKLP